MNEKTDAELVAAWRQTLESCKAHYLYNWLETSLHISAGDLSIILTLAELALRMKLVTVEDERSYLVVRDERDNQWPLPWPTDTDPDTARLSFDDIDPATPDVIP
jgi:hypothetical protein